MSFWERQETTRSRATGWSLAQIGAAIGRIPSGCLILSVQHMERRTGVLVSWVQQAAFEPPSLSVCLKRDRPAVELLDGSGQCMLNVIGEDPTAMFKHFGRGFPLDEDAFAGLQIQETQFGPLLLGCIAHLGCRVREKIFAGDHALYVVEVVAGNITSDGKPYVHVRKNGMTY